jgi:hypothetical protein
VSEVLRRFLEEHRRLLTAILGLLLGNVLFWVAVTGPAGLRRAALKRDLEGAEREAREALHGYGKARLEAMLFEAAEERITELYTSTFRSGRERYTTVDAKVKEIASRFGLEPHSLAYSYTPQVRERLEQLAIAFNLKGSYDNLRRFITEVEQARDGEGNDLFFAIERVSLVDSTETGSELNLHLTITTYFHRPELAAEDRSAGPGAVNFDRRRTGS